jgi:hypothetical protein
VQRKLQWKKAKSGSNYMYQSTNYYFFFDDSDEETKDHYDTSTA